MVKIKSDNAHTVSLTLYQYPFHGNNYLILHEWKATFTLPGDTGLILKESSKIFIRGVNFLYPI